MEPRLIYHLPLIGGYLYRRNMRRLGRELAASFRKGMDSVRPGLDEFRRAAMCRCSVLPIEAEPPTSQGDSPR